MYDLIVPVFVIYLEAVWSLSLKCHSNKDYLNRDRTKDIFSKTKYARVPPCDVRQLNIVCVMRICNLKISTSKNAP